MRTHVALLRGINVGGRNRVAMTDLWQIATSLGHTDVATYIQSGNVLFTSTGTDTITLADALEQEIARRLDVKPGVVVLSRDQLAGVMAGNPYPQAGDPRCLHAVFRREDMSPEESAAVVAAQQRASDKGSRDEAAVARDSRVFLIACVLASALAQRSRTDRPPPAITASAVSSAPRLRWPVREWRSRSRSIELSRTDSVFARPGF